MTKKKTSKRPKSGARTQPEARQSDPKLVGFAGMELLAVRLTHIEASLQFKSGKRPPNAPVINIGCNTVSKPEEGRTIVFVNVSVEATHADDAESRMFVHVTEELIYSGVLPDDPDEKSAGSLMVTSVLASWPYVRQSVQGATSQMLLPPLVLPLLRIDVQSGTLKIGDAVMGFQEMVESR